MRITVYNVKGGVGKTPIATNIALEREYAIGTNERFHVFDSFIPDDRILSIGLTEPFPAIPDDIDIVFDLAGAIDEAALSIVSAIRQSEIVLVPVNAEVKALHSAINTIREIGRVEGFAGRIVAVATKLTKSQGENFQRDWSRSRDFQTIEGQLRATGFEGPVLPLKLSKAFDAVFEREMAISRLRAVDPLSRHSFRDVAEQFDAILSTIDEVAHARKEQRLRSSA